MNSIMASVIWETNQFQEKKYYPTAQELHRPMFLPSSS